MIFEVTEMLIMAGQRVLISQPMSWVRRGDNSLLKSVGEGSRLE